MVKKLLTISLFVITSLTVIVILLFSFHNTMVNWLFSDKEYQKYISINPYLMNSDQICQVFSRENINLIQSPYNLLNYKDLYLVIRLRNNRNNAFWGILDCKIDEKNIRINIPLQMPNLNKFNNFIVPIPCFISGQGSNLPNFEIEWIELHKK